MTQWMGNLFYRRQPIDVIRSLRFAEMKFWNEWHERMQEADKEAYENARKK